MPGRLSALDASFLTLETPTAHMHIAWRGRFLPAEHRPRPTLEAIQAHVAARLPGAPRFRQRLAFPAGGFAGPVWVEDAAFAVEEHVSLLAPADRAVPLARFAELCDLALSQPLDRRRPLWRMLVAPLLDDGTIGVLMQMHHAMVDGVGAVALAALVLDGTPEPWVPEPASEAGVRRTPGSAELAARSLLEAGVEPWRAAGRVAGLAATGPGRARLASTLRRAALAVGEDVLRPAAPAFVNGSLSPLRALRGHTTDLEPLREAATVHDATLNDAVLAVVAGALRQVSLMRGVAPARLKAMVPVNTRTDVAGAGEGNRIAFVSVDLPLHRGRAVDRLQEIRSATAEFKRSERARGSEVLLDALALLPRPLHRPAAQLAASQRAYNVVVSNVPGPAAPVYLLGAAAVEALPVVPLSDGHALSVGALSLDGRIGFGAYADPVLLPEVEELPGALSQSVLELVLAGRRARSAGTPSAPVPAARGPRSASGRAR